MLGNHCMFYISLHLIAVSPYTNPSPSVHQRGRRGCLLPLDTAATPSTISFAT